MICARYLFLIELLQIVKSFNQLIANFSENHRIADFYLLLCYAYNTVKKIIFSLQFCNLEILLHFNLAFSQCSDRICYQALNGQTDVFGYLISQFFPTRKIRENLMHMENVCVYSI